MSNNKSQNGTSRSDEIFADFQEWKKHVSDDEIREIINDDDCLNRTEISKALDCSRSAVYSNRMQNAITEFEDEKRKEGILPKKSEQDVSKDSNKKSSNSNKGEALAEFNGSNNELLYLRKRNSDLEEENMILKAELKRFGELGALISDELD